MAAERGTSVAHHDWLTSGGTQPRIKICCIASVEEGELALDAGADLLGLVSAMPSGPGPIEESEIAAVVRALGSRADTVLLTSLRDARSIGRQLDRMRPAVVQLVDSVAEQELTALRNSHPDVVLMQVIHVLGESSIADAVAVAPLVDAILLDSGNPNAAVKELGGTGRVHDWRVSRALVDAVSLPVILAGGLRPDNVAEAVRTVQPFGVDVCSGVRTGGRLDPDKARAFVREVRAAR